MEHIQADKIKRIHVFGIVQGVGFRPTVSRHAMRFGIKGSVCNMGPYVEIYARAGQEALNGFIKAIEEEPPQRAVILRMDVEDLEPLEGPDLTEDFEIIESGKIEGDIFVSPDIAVCDQCSREMYDPRDRRYLHPFINCTCCGPRLTILDSMPYDRVRTSMADFPMCPECAYEYSHPETRRYDAQPVCCNECGPEVYILDPASGRALEKGSQAIRAVRQLIRDGGIAAIKGIGGFHLCCDAGNEEAVRRLRQRKCRPQKPFAVIMRNIDIVKRECLVSPWQEEILTGHQKPILLLQKRKDSRVRDLVAPDNPKLGVMLPYAPVQLLLFDSKDEIRMPDCLVMTSANARGAPLCRDDQDVAEEIGGFCDLVLSHNRLIRIRADDTVMDDFRGGPYMIRRSRGYAPLPVMVDRPWQGQVLAVGAELKNSFCVGKKQLLYPSPYVGDMGDVRTVRALQESSARMEDLLEADPSLIVCDSHPGYNTTYFAKDLGEKRGLPVLEVQHHYAHILSCMAENDWKEGRVIGVAFDGTGYGSDASIWGGEILLCDYGTFSRWASLEPFIQPGGDASAREGWRVAVSLLLDRFGKEEGIRLACQLDLCGEKEARMIAVMAQRGINSVMSTSAGRLFDAVSAVLGVRRVSTYEGEASIQLQFAAQRWQDWEKRTGRQVSSKYMDGSELPGKDITGSNGPDKDMAGSEFLLGEEPAGCAYDEDKGRWLLPSGQLFEQLVRERLAGTSTESLAFTFHRSLADMVVEACVKASRETGTRTVALSGGVYQNTLLLDLCIRGLEDQGLQVLRHRMIPPNDGGIGLGQAAFGLEWLTRQDRLRESGAKD